MAVISIEQPVSLMGFMAKMQMKLQDWRGQDISTNGEVSSVRRKRQLSNVARRKLLCAQWVVASLVCFIAAQDGRTQTIATVAGSAPCGVANPLMNSFDDPSAITVDAAGNIYFSVISAVCKLTPAGTVSLVAGNGVLGYSGDGGAATTATLGAPSGVAVDAAGNVYIADSLNNRIRKVATNGMISTVAGNRRGGYGGDGGPATGAELNLPSGVTIDSIGNLYIADRRNGRIRKVATNGTISTVAGGGSSYDSDGGPATSAVLEDPTGVAVDAIGNLYIADGIRARVRKVAPDGTINTVAGNGVPGYSGDGGSAISATFKGPSGVAVDTGGNLYIADQGNSVIRKVTKNGTVSTVAGNGVKGFGGEGGLAVNATISGPFGVAVDLAGNLYIPDGGNNRVRKVIANGTITTIAGTGVVCDGDNDFWGGSGACDGGDGGPATIATLGYADSIAIDSVGNLYIAGYNRVRKVSKDGTINTVAGDGEAGYSGDGGPATSARFTGPTGVAVDSVGNLYIADSADHRVRKVAANGIITSVVGNGTSSYVGDGGPARDTGINPNGLAVDAAGNLYIGDSFNNCVRKVSLNGTITTVAGSGVQGYSGDGGQAINAELFFPTGVAVDAADNLYIVDKGNYRVRKVAPNGTISTVAGSRVGGYGGEGGPATDASLWEPNAIAVDTDGNLYIADTGNNRIRAVSVDGTINTIAGSGAFGFVGDGGSATAAALDSPGGVAVDRSGNVYIADSLNHRAREVSKVNSEGIAGATISLTTRYNPSLLGQSLPLVSKLTGSNPTGTVTFKDMSTGILLCDATPIRAAAITGQFSAYCATDSNSSTLAAGIHTFVAMYSGDAQNSSATAILNVEIIATQGFNPNQFGLTGSWYTPETSGQGFVTGVYENFPSVGSGTFFAGWYTYSIDGATRDWYTLQGTVVQDESSTAVNIYSGAGGKFNTPVTTNPANSAQFGTATIIFGDCRHMSIAYSFTDGSGRSGTIPLQRLDVDLSCSVAGDTGSIAGTSQQYSGAWYNPQVSGQGLAIDLSPSQNAFFAGWYTFDLDGNRIWFSIQGAWSSMQTSASNLAIFQATDGLFNDPTPIKLQQVGTANISFTDCTHGSLGYIFTEGPLAGRNGSIPVQPVGPAAAGCQ